MLQVVSAFDFFHRVFTFCSVGFYAKSILALDVGFCLTGCILGWWFRGAFLAGFYVPVRL